MKKLKLGFLSVLGNEENHSEKMGGVFEAAADNNVSVIRFAARVHYEDYNMFNLELHNLYNVIDAQKLDGLMFLGWMPGIVGKFFDDFLKRFSYMPLVSLGANYDNVPNVYADPEKSLTHLLNHLIDVHGCKNIVFVPPCYPDIRMNIYTGIMKEHGLFQDNLLISYDDLKDIPLQDRMKKVMSILIDERKVDVDAIFVMFDTDAQTLFQELHSRGISVPGEIAVVSNEDSEFANYSLPPLTVVTFPWRDVGYYGCKKIIQIIRNEKIEHTTGLSGKLIIRNSCGCLSNSVTLSKIEDRQEIAASAGAADYKNMLHFSDQIQKAFPSSQLNTEKLLYSLIEDFEGRTTTQFFEEFEKQLQDTVNRSPYRGSIDEIEEIIYFLRNLVIPYIAPRSQDVVLFDDILLKSTVIIKEKFVSILGYDNIEMNAINQELHFLSQHLSGTFSAKKLASVLENNLHKLRIPSCCVYLSREKTFSEFSLLLYYSDNARIASDDTEAGTGCLSDEFVEKHPRLLCQLLHIEDEYLGFVVFEPLLFDARIYERLSLHISSSLKSAILLEKLSEEIALRKEKELQLMHNANYDSLTDLYNRRFFVRTIHYILDRAVRYPEKKLRFYLVFIDFDDFKQVNDNFGHDVGDLLIIEISKKFKNLIQRYSYHIPEEIIDDGENGMSEAVFRLGGDEFTAIVAGISMEEMKELASELINTVKSPYLIEGHEIRISCSLGISIYPDHSDNADQLIKYADMAMYHAKMTKDMFCFYDNSGCS